MIKFKAIKAKPLNSKEMSELVRNSTKEYAETMMLPEFEHVTDGWDGEKPDWISKYKAGATFFMVSIEPSNPNSKGAQKWKWLDEGTKPHKIPKNPSPDSLLVFLSEYTPGSKPGSLSTSSAQSGGELIFIRGKQIDHPGTAPRGWTDLLVERIQPKFEQFGEALMYEVAKISGHGA